MTVNGKGEIEARDTLMEELGGFSNGYSVYRKRGISDVTSPRTWKN